MKARVKTHAGYEEKSLANDCVWLLSQIRSVTLQFHDSKDSFMCILDAQFGFHSFKQKPGESADDYTESLIGWSDTIETHGDRKPQVDRRKRLTQARDGPRARDCHGPDSEC